MLRRKSEWPTIDEFVMCTVTKIFNQGAFMRLDEYGGEEGMVHISEVASGWIKNIRDYVREGQKAVCKVLAVDPKRKHIDLSIRRVKDSERRWKVQQLKREQRAEKLLELAAGKLGKSLDEAYEEVGFTLEDKFGDLYSALESAAKDKSALIDVVKDQRWVEVLSDIAASKVEPPSYNVVGYLDLSCPSPNGVEVIKSALIDARDSTKRNGTNVEFYYVGSPRYRVEITAPSYKVAESVMQKAVEEAIAAVKKAGGKGEFHRTGRR
ncbi:MAG: translation initiation factor IF-2 subunit alpha [Hadesarchaea archaeon]|nr:translation initiation factor IF-2 subunit alpha [Hadesarchaea archaeon]MDH5685407.1 translation initiation factor IF-2 subunit alpha [Hadesarchaea archaeon]